MTITSGTNNDLPEAKFVWPNGTMTKVHMGSKGTNATVSEAHVGTNESRPNDKLKRKLGKS